MKNIFNLLATILIAVGIILIAGSGFMGTSMAHALENCNISCFETHEAYLATLKNLNIYKNIFSDVSDIKGEFDLIIICNY